MVCCMALNVFRESLGGLRKILSVEERPDVWTSAKNV